MDEITLLRAMRADAGSPTDATIEAGRTKLLQRITPPPLRQGFPPAVPVGRVSGSPRQQPPRLWRH
jgi:hypothetical protein